METKKHRMGRIILRNYHCRAVCRKYYRETVLTEKSVESLNQLVEKGYPRNHLLQIAHSEDFSQVGFSTGDKRKNYYFYTAKLQKYLERREQIERS